MNANNKKPHAPFGSSIDANQEDYGKARPFIIATKHGNFANVKELLEHGADPNSLTVDGETPLNIAIEHGHTDVAKLLVKFGADPYAQNSAGITPLGNAIYKGCYNFVKLVLKNEKGPYGQPHLFASSTGQTALGILPIKSANELVKFLIKFGADINIIDKLGITPRVIAEENNDQELKDLLQKNSQNPSIKKIKNRLIQEHNFLNAAEIADNKILNGMLCDHTFKKSKKLKSAAPLRACANGDIATTKLLLEYGAEIHKSDEDGNTPLTAAIYRGHLEIVKFFLERSPNLNTRSKILRTLHHAARSGNYAILEYLFVKSMTLKKKANKNEKADLLIDSVIGQNTKIIDFLLQNNFPINGLTDTDGYTALMQAAHYDNQELIKFLLNRGADISRRNKCGWTALIIAAQEGHIENVQLLLQHGASSEQSGDLYSWLELSYK